MSFKEKQNSNLKDKLNYKMPIGHKQTKAIAFNEKYCAKKMYFVLTFQMS